MKRTVILILVFVCVFSLYLVPASAAVTLFEEDFSGYNQGDVPTNFSQDSSGLAPQGRIIRDVGSPYDEAFAIDVVSDSTTQSAATNYADFVSTYPSITAKADLYVESQLPATAGSKGEFNIVHQGTRAAVFVDLSDDMMYAFSTGGNNALILLGPTGNARWHAIKMVINYTTGTYDVFINGRKLGDDIALGTYSTTNTQARFYVGAPPGIFDTSIEIDNILIRDFVPIPQTGEPINYTWIYILSGLIIAFGIGITLRKTVFDKI